MGISIENLSFSYYPGTVYELEALKNINLEIREAEFIGIAGRTGCGKSSLLQIMAGLLRPSRGRVLLEGEDINAKAYDRRRLRGRLGIVFQYPEYQLFESTVYKDVCFALKRLGMTEPEQRTAAKKALELMGFDFDKIAGRCPMELSGGQKRRAALAGILASEPAYLLLDEPVAGLDGPARKEFLSLLDSLRQKGTAVVMVSHNAEAIAEHADRLIVMENGEITADAPPEKIYASPALTAASQGIPPAAHVRELLRERGIAVPGDICREAELERALIRLLKGEEK